MNDSKRCEHGNLRSQNCVLCELERRRTDEAKHAPARPEVSSTEWLDADVVIAAISAEPELPGDMPDQMWAAVQNDRDAAVELLRIVVRQTKEGIAERLGLKASNVVFTDGGEKTKPEK